MSDKPEWLTRAELALAQHEAQEQARAEVEEAERARKLNEENRANGLDLMQALLQILGLDIAEVIGSQVCGPEYTWGDYSFVYQFITTSRVKPKIEGGTPIVHNWRFALRRYVSDEMYTLTNWPHHLYSDPEYKRHWLEVTDITTPEAFAKALRILSKKYAEFEQALADQKESERIHKGLAELSAMQPAIPLLHAPTIRAVMLLETTASEVRWDRPLNPAQELVLALAKYLTREE